jgi:methanol metabolism-related c-type cytochrome
MRFGRRFLLAATIATSLLSPAFAQTAPTVAPAADKTTEKTMGPEGKWTLKDGSPTYNIQADGTMDWFTYSGFRRYHAECHVCHGPEAQGSTYAPALVDSLKEIDYAKFMQVVASGQQNVRYQGNSIMPALGDNKNVMCYLDDIYTYIKALSDSAIPRGRPGNRVDKTPAQAKNENECLG